jgi:MFS family permease
MEALEAILVALALVAGLTGTWSPCGFSMIETIGPRGHDGGRATTAAACVTFAIGALVGGVATFGLLAALGSLTHGAGEPVAYGIGAAIAIAAAFAEARGRAIMPQVRRQLPEHWRRFMPMPVAAGLYGVLLGLGFTTFVLTFGVFALAGIAFAVGEPLVGLAVGLAFGAGRALPIVAIAPVADREPGVRALTLMAERPAIYRGFRLADAAVLAAAAAALTVVGPAEALRPESRPAADPTVGAGALVVQRPDRSGVLIRGGAETPLPGRDPAIGAGRIAVVQGDEIALLSAKDLGEVGRVRAPGADALAVSGSWLVWRAHVGGRDLMRARNLRDPARPGPERSLGRVGRTSQLGRPSLDGNRLVYARATQRDNRIILQVLGGKHGARRATLLRSDEAGLSNPSIRGRYLAYVQHTRRADRLRLGRVKRPGHARLLLARKPRSLWSTALLPGRVYVTVIGGTAPRQRVLSVRR